MAFRSPGWIQVCPHRPGGEGQGRETGKSAAGGLAPGCGKRILPPRHCSRGERVATTEKAVSIPKGPIPNPGLAEVDYLSW